MLTVNQALQIMNDTDGDNYLRWDREEFYETFIDNYKVIMCIYRLIASLEAVVFEEINEAKKMRRMLREKYFEATPDERNIQKEEYETAMKYYKDIIDENSNLEVIVYKEEELQYNPLTQFVLDNKSWLAGIDAVDQKIRNTTAPIIGKAVDYTLFPTKWLLEKNAELYEEQEIFEQGIEFINSISKRIVNAIMA